MAYFFFDYAVVEFLISSLMGGPIFPGKLRSAWVFTSINACPQVESSYPLEARDVG